MTQQELKEQYDMAVAYGYVNDARFKKAFARMKKKVRNKTRQ